jgi:hypothetical protein
MGRDIAEAVLTSGDRPLSVAVMVVEPVAAELARPPELITAMLTLEEDHLTRR